MYVCVLGGQAFEHECLCVCVHVGGGASVLNTSANVCAWGKCLNMSVYVWGVFKHECLCVCLREVLEHVSVCWGGKCLNTSAWGVILLSHHDSS